MKAPQHIVQWLATHIHFGGKGFLVHFHEGTADVEVLGKVIIPIYSEHGFAHDAPVILAFEAHAYVGSGIDDALVDDPNDSALVIHRVVSTFSQFDAAGSHYH